MTIALLIWLLIMLFVGYMLSNKNIFAPSVLTSAVWIFMLLMFYYLEHDLPSLKNQVLLSIFLWTTGFVLSSLLIQSITFTKTKYTQNTPNKLIRDVYFILSVATFPLLLLFAFEAIKYGETGEWAIDLRNAAIGATERHAEPYSGLYLILWKVAYAIELCYCTAKNRYRVYVLAFMYIAMGILLMSKAVFLEFAVITVVVLWFKGAIKIKFVLIVGAALFFCFIILQQLRHHLSSGENAKNDFLVLYVVGHLSAFDTLKPCSSTNLGENVFRIFYAIPYKLGMSSIPPIDPLLPWIKEPLRTNTYTCMYPFFVDFGYKGVFCFSLLYGTLFGWIYKKIERSKNLFFVLLYALMFNVVLMQYVAEILLTNFAIFVYIILFLVFPFVFTLKNETVDSNNHSAV